MEFDSEFRILLYKLKQTLNIEEKNILETIHSTVACCHMFVPCPDGSFLFCSQIN